MQTIGSNEPAETSSKERMQNCLDINLRGCVDYVCYKPAGELRRTPGSSKWTCIQYSCYSL